MEEKDSFDLSSLALDLSIDSTCSLTDLVELHEKLEYRVDDKTNLLELAVLHYLKHNTTAYLLARRCKIDEQG